MALNMFIPHLTHATGEWSKEGQQMSDHAVRGVQTLQKMAPQESTEVPIIHEMQMHLNFLANQKK